MLTFIATDLQLYKIFNIKQVSFFGTQCNEFTFIVDDGLLMASTSISGYGACETLIPVTVLYNDLATKLNEQHDCHITGRMADIFFSFTCFTLHLPESHSYSWDKTFFVIYISTIEQPAVVNVGTAITVPPVGLCDTQSYV